MMKNNLLRLAVIISTFLILAVLLCSCKKDPPATYSVTFEWNNGAVATVVDVTEGSNPSVPETPANFGYRFDGWYSDATFTNAAYPDSTAVSSNVTYYAKWISEDYVRISFDTKGGTAVSPVGLKKGDKLDASKLASPEKEGYTFSGWYKNAACTSSFHAEVDIPAASMTLYAGWTLNDGMGECIGMVNGKEVARVAFPAGTPVLPTTNDGVSYVWYTTPTMNTVFAETEVSSSVVLYGMAYTEGLVIENNTVTGYNGTERNVIVPQRWNGVVVTSVSKLAFAHQTSIKSVVLPETVTSVGKSAFYDCTALLSVNLTGACTSVGEFAFYNCNSLATVGDLSGLLEITDSAFAGCKRLTGIAFSENLRSVGSYAFADCSSVDAFRLPDSVISIGEFAFSGCTAVREFHIPKGLVVLGTGALNGCSALQTLSYSDNNNVAPYRVIDGNLYEGNGKKLILYVRGDKTETSFALPEGATEVAAYAFSGNTNLTELVLDGAGVKIEKAALAGMKALEKLFLYSLNETDGYLAYYFGAESGKANGTAGIFSPATLSLVSYHVMPTAIPEYAFFGFSGLTQFRAGDTDGFAKLRKMGQYAFAYTALNEVNIPASLTYIEENAFYGCSSIHSFTVNEGNSAFGSFDGCLYDKGLTTLYLVPLTKTEITFPNTVKTIASGAFYRSNVRILEIPSSVETIEFGALSSVLRLEELTVPFIGRSAAKTEENNYMIYLFGGTVQKTLRSDGSYSYSTGNTYCTPPSLKKLTVAGAVTKIPNFAFAYFSDVAEIICNGEITEIGDYAFFGSGLTELNVPDTVTKIGKYAFGSMSELVSATIPGSVGANLGEALFYNCSYLETVVFEEGVTLIPANAFYPSASRDSKTNELNYYSKLISITLPASLKRIDAFAFAYAGTRYIGSIGSVYADMKFVLPANNHLQVIEEGAFYRSSIPSITISAELTEIKEMAFFGCEKLATVSFGTAEEHSQLEKIGGAAFAMCKGLRKISIYKDIASVDDIPEIELYETEENTTYNVFYGASVPSVYVYGADIYRRAKNWDEYDTHIFTLGD